MILRHALTFFSAAMLQWTNEREHTLAICPPHPPTRHRQMTKQAAIHFCRRRRFLASLAFSRLYIAASLDIFPPFFFGFIEFARLRCKCCFCVQIFFFALFLPILRGSCYFLSRYIKMDSQGSFGPPLPHTHTHTHTQNVTEHQWRGCLLPTPLSTGARGRDSSTVC